MRRLLSFFLLLCCITAISNATIITVSNDPNKPAQFSSPTTALAAASPGDTLYIYGSPNNYGAFTINKNITIIGAGFNTRKDIFYKTVFTTITLSGPTRDGVTVDGIYCTGFSIDNSLSSYSNITIRNVLLYGSISGVAGSPMTCGSTFTNWLIENSFIQNLTLPGNSTCNPVGPITSGFLVKNSTITNFGNLNYNITFVNCQFGTDGGASNNFSNVWNCLFNNSIFYRMNFSQSSINQNNQFNNCLTYLTSTPGQTFDLNSWSGGASGSANNCIINQNPLWFTAPTLPLFSNNSPGIRNVWNPELQAGSPVLTAGTDGTAIGLTGGAVPYNYLAEPKIPVVRKYQLVNAVVPPSGTVTANATATKAQ